MSYQCEIENEVREACRADLWTPALREHASHCAACAEVVIVAESLLHEAEIAGSGVHLPSSSQIWWRAQLAEKNAAFMRATRPITLVTALSFVVGALGLVWLIVGPVETTAGKYPAYLQSLLSLCANSTALMMTTGTLLCLLFGSLYLVWRE